MLPLMTDYWKMRIGLLITPKDDASMNIKLEAWKSFITYWKQSPLLGWGPAKDTLGYSVDNEWLMLLSRYGIAGVIVFILFGFAIFRVLNRAAKRAAFPEIYGLNLALKAFIPAASIFMFVGGIYHNLQIMSVFLILIAWSTKQTKINVVHYDERKWGDPSVLCGNDSRGNISAN
jgi:O-antigen ligase